MADATLRICNAPNLCGVRILTTGKPIDCAVPLLGFAAFSGTGKTTLLKKLLLLAKRQGLRIGVVKHTHHRFEIDKPGKDSYELRKAGAAEMLVASGSRWALMVDTDEQEDPSLQTLLWRMDLSSLDLLLVEGFRHETMPKIELHRPALGKPLMFPNDASIIALATDGLPAIQCEIPLLDINDATSIFNFIVSRFVKKNPKSS